MSDLDDLLNPPKDTPWLCQAGEAGARCDNRGTRWVPIRTGSGRIGFQSACSDEHETILAARRPLYPRAADVSYPVPGLAAHYIDAAS